MRKAVLVFLIGVLVSPCIAKYSGGSGEPNNPYQIANVTDLLILAADTNDYNKCFIMTADIDIDPNLPGGQVFTTAVIARDTNNANTTFDGKTFTGKFDGDGHKIINLTIDTNGVGNDYSGLFGHIRGCEIKNLGLENISITGGYGSVALGGLIGYNDGGYIIDCYSTGAVTGGNRSFGLGGLIGYNDSGYIIDCSSTVAVTGGDYSGILGGLTGGFYGSGTISNCFSAGNVAGGDNSSGLGGLVGDNSDVDIIDCYSTGAVTGGTNSYNLGGLVGYSGYSSISNCFSTGVVVGGDGSLYLGGLGGWNNGSINNCYSTGAVSGGSFLGGLVGVNYRDSSVSNCYSTGGVANISGNGGLIGYNDGNIINSYFLITSRPINGYGIPLTDEEMKQQASFIDWDFNDIWAICETTNYPKLLWQILTGDIVCPDGVDIEDLAELCEQWLVEEIPADLAPPPSGDGIVDFADFSIFANQWGITNDIDELLDFTGQWLKMGLPICSADISPMPAGDGRVDAEDFAVMANDWLEGF